ncbi:hypothetical protein MIMGU_mgv1a021587mg [Erythranthe guttata]|uniref:Uncharacterized protein n=1 Tax=Erythranthe guttata TaxID=4155 RepID=A0A022PT97_ERYGU|nr:hypothetical protein MIMGU_mgv1a021587mg [Erythranthe guttata]
MNCIPPFSAEYNLTMGLIVSKVFIKIPIWYSSSKIKTFEPLYFIIETILPIYYTLKRVLSHSITNS